MTFDTDTLLITGLLVVHVMFLLAANTIDQLQHLVNKPLWRYQIGRRAFASRDHSSPGSRVCREATRRSILQHLMRIARTGSVDKR